MSIRSIGSSYGPPRAAAPAPTAPASPTAPTAPADQAPAAKPHGPPAHAKAHGFRARQDSVAISDAARALAGGADEAKSAGSLTPERVADLRRKVLEGAYNQTSMVDQVAKRLLSSGDV